jgi:peroxiredoxin
LKSRINEIHELDAEVLAISIDPPEINGRVAAKHGLTFPILSDHNREAMDRFALHHEDGGMEGDDIFRPAVFILDREGSIVWRHLTDDWRVRVRPEEIIEILKQSRDVRLDFHEGTGTSSEGP